MKRITFGEAESITEFPSRKLAKYGKAFIEDNFLRLSESISTARVSPCVLAFLGSGRKYFISPPPSTNPFIPIFLIIDISLNPLSSIFNLAGIEHEIHGSENKQR